MKASLRFIVRHLMTPLLFPAAVLFVVVEQIGSVLKRLVMRIPLPALWLRVEAAMLRLPAYGALACLMIPLGVFLGLQVVEVALLAGKHFALALLTSLGAKVVGVGIGLRLWTKLEANVRRIAWVGWVVDAVVGADHAVHAWLNGFAAWRRARAWVEKMKAGVKRLGQQWAARPPGALKRRFAAARRWVRGA